MEHNQELLAARVRLRFATPPASTREGFLWFAEEILPLSEESRTGARLYTAIQARAGSDPAVASLAVLAVEGLTGFFRGQLEQARERGDVRAGLDVDLAARSLYSTVSGLVAPLLFGAYTREQAMGVLGERLEWLFG